MVLWLGLQAFDINSPENPSILAVNYYPPMTEEEVQKKQPPRLHAHADMDVLTILYQRAGTETDAVSLAFWYFFLIDRCTQKDILKLKGGHGHV